MIERKPDADLEIKRAAQLSITEITLGSIGHAFKIPFTGQILSLNQLGFMLNALNKDSLPIASTFEISSISTVLKSFSPAGQKLGPMLSIAMQGFLFWFFCFLGQAHLIGQIIGAIFMALWSFVQPLITYFIIYGFDLINVAEFYEKRMRQDYSVLHKSILIAVGLFILLKLFVAVSLVIYSVITKKEIKLIKQDKLHSLTSGAFEKSNLSPWKAAFKDLFRPLFISSFILMIVFIWQIESSSSQKIWMALRPLAVAYLVFYLLRSPWTAKKLGTLSKKSKFFNRVYTKSKAALALVARKKES
ncbi:MAG: hypothetical protein H7328_08925 [Bdellovibrio sp.]|nr:hypothetical protein [Bdellovibrio sp.]